MIFDADIVLIPRAASVEVALAGTHPGSSPDAEAEKAAVLAIREGVLAVLGPRGLGARVRVTNLLVHPIDFVARKFRDYTIRYLERALAVVKQTTEG